MLTLTLHLMGAVQLNSVKPKVRRAGQRFIDPRGDRIYTAPKARPIGEE
jgi:hypothetical protein